MPSSIFAWQARQRVNPLLTSNLKPGNSTNGLTWWATMLLLFSGFIPQCWQVNSSRSRTEARHSRYSGLPKRIPCSGSEIPPFHLLLAAPRRALSRIFSRAASVGFLPLLFIESVSSAPGVVSQIRWRSAKRAIWAAIRGSDFADLPLFQGAPRRPFFGRFFAAHARLYSLICALCSSRHFFSAPNFVCQTRLCSSLQYRRGPATGSEQSLHGVNFVVEKGIETAEMQDNTLYQKQLTPVP